MSLKNMRIEIVPLLSLITVINLGLIPGLQAQIIGDGSTSTQVQTEQNKQGQNELTVTGGVNDGRNLFHSFSEFSLPTHSIVNFENNLANIQNVIGRVTGNSISHIDGLIQASGSSPNFNLYLLNPNGFLFGPNSSLNLQGSFLATTAKAIVFDNGSLFQTNDSQIPSLLRINTPIGLQFGQKIGQITVKTVSWELPAKTSLALVGGDVTLTDSGITIPDGQVFLGGLSAPGLISLTQNSNLWVMNFPLNSERSDVSLTGGSLDVSGVGGRFDIISRNALFLNGIFIRNSGTGGEIDLDATHDITFTGKGNSEPSAILTINSADDVGNNISIRAGSLFLSDGVALASITSGMGRAGNIVIDVLGDITVKNGVIASTVSGGAIGGQGGNVEIKSRSLSILEGAQINTGIAKARNREINQGKGGDIIINASDFVNIAGFDSMTGFSGGIFTLSEKGTFGSAGNIELTTPNLQIADGAVINAQTKNLDSGGNIHLSANQVNIVRGGQVISSTTDGGQGGNIDLNIQGRLNIEGSDPNYAIRISQLGSDIVGSVAAVSGLFANTEKNSTGNGGNISINTHQLIVKNGAEITAGSLGQGNAGNLNLQANSILLANQGKLTTESASGEGGNITLNFQNLLILINKSLISATAGTQGGNGNGGNIQISGGFVIAQPAENSDLIANAFTGNGGNIQLNIQGIFGIDSRSQQTSLSDVTASSAFGKTGVVAINRADIDPQNSLTTLPSDVFAQKNVLVQHCGQGGEFTRGEFFVTGRGGLPPNPNNGVETTSTLSELGYPNVSYGFSENSSIVKPRAELREVAMTPAEANVDSVNANSVSEKTIQEAKNWIRDSQGKILLIAQSISASSEGSDFPRNICLDLSKLSTSKQSTSPAKFE